jgi:hypothetical protein
MRLNQACDVLFQTLAEWLQRLSCETVTLSRELALAPTHLLWTCSGAQAN